MMNLEVETSQALDARLADLQARVRAEHNQPEMKTFQKVAAIMDNGRGQIAAET